MRPSKVNKRENIRINKRRINDFRLKKAARLREKIGVIKHKKVLKTCFLNVDGLGAVTFEDIKNTVKLKNPDIIYLVETKRRLEDIAIDISIPGYSLHEVRRSDTAGDKDGGGIAVFTKLTDGILFKLHTPDIAGPDAAFVANERLWITVESQSCKTAVCGLYLGCQYSDDRNAGLGYDRNRIFRPDTGMEAKSGSGIAGNGMLFQNSGSGKAGKGMLF